LFFWGGGGGCCPCWRLGGRIDKGGERLIGKVWGEWGSFLSLASPSFFFVLEEGGGGGEPNQLGDSNIEFHFLKSCS
jgi:hypothetical protein